MNTKLKNPAMDTLMEAILTLQSLEECYKFFDDLCTVNELQSLAQRFMVAVMLNNGKTYIEISEKTGASTATISRVNRSLHYGADGYQAVIDKLSEKESYTEG